jgi:hypothetical protein
MVGHDNRTAPVFAMDPSREGWAINLRLVFSACSARSSHRRCSCSNFALVTGSRADSAAAAICALTAEDILVEHSSKATGADCCSYRDGTALWSRQPAWAAAPRIISHTARPPACYRHVLALDIAVFSQSPTERRQQVWDILGRPRAEKPDHRHLLSLRRGWCPRSGSEASRR